MYQGRDYDRPEIVIFINHLSSILTSCPFTGQVFSFVFNSCIWFSLLTSLQTTSRKLLARVTAKESMRKDVTTKKQELWNKALVNLKLFVL